MFAETFADLDYLCFLCGSHLPPLLLPDSRKNGVKVKLQETLNLIGDKLWLSHVPVLIIY